MKRHFTTVLLMLLLLIGLGLLLYPTVSDYWNSLHQSRAMATYAETMSNIDTEEYERLWNEAAAYNEDLVKTGVMWQMTEEQTEAYNNLLDVSESGMMAYIEIPKINCSLPIYHGTGEGVLQIAIGHLEGTSLPVGGESSHCVLSGHRGLPSARLFTDLDDLVEGDQFFIRTLDEVLTYEVDQIRVVLPSDLSELNIVKGQDYCTLVTCTPYGVNTHRLLVRGHRVQNTEEARVIMVPAEAMRIPNYVMMLGVGVPMLMLYLIAVLINTRRRPIPPTAQELVNRLGRDMAGGKPRAPAAKKSGTDGKEENAP